MERTYLCCDLKSYYASVECIDRRLDPMAINLVVADAARTDKTICLAVSPALSPLAYPADRGCLRSSRECVTLTTKGG